MLPSDWEYCFIRSQVRQPPEFGIVIRKWRSYNKMKLSAEPNEPKIVPKSRLENQKNEKKTLMT